MARVYLAFVGASFLMCCLAYCGAPDTAESRLQEIFNRDPVVKARALRTWPAPEQGKGYYRHIVVITHVYCGPKELIGKAISVLGRGPEAGGGNTLGWVSPPLDVGENVIAELEHREERNGEPPGWYVRDCSDQYFSVCREKENLQYIKDLVEFGKKGAGEQRLSEELIERHRKEIERCIHFSEALEAIWRAKPEKRWDLLAELVRSRDDCTCEWAMNILRAVKPKWPDGFYDSLVNDETCPIVGQQHLDDLLCELGGDQWSQSPQRHRMLKSWATRKLTKEDAELVVNRILEFRSSDRQWDNELRGLARENKTIPESLKKRL